jgi:hypothetical protein
MGKSREDAEDLVQGFMARLIESEGLRYTDRVKGRFRTFLLASFNHWMIKGCCLCNNAKMCPLVMRNHPSGFDFMAAVLRSA